jgi:predicted nucleotidyltransferase
MDKTQVISKLRQHEPELKAAGIAHVHLFGSTGRGEAAPASDIDLMIDFDESKPQSLMSLSRLKNQLTDLLGQEVDLSSADWMYDHIRRQAQSEAVLAF